jgi:hypothetical protein
LTAGNVSLALKQLICCLIKRLQDGQIILPAGAFTRYLRILSKNVGVGLSAFLRVPRRFRRCEPPIIAGFSASSTPFFEGRLTEVDVVADAASPCDPKAFSSKRAAYYVRLFVSVNTFFRRS